MPFTHQDILQIRYRWRTNHEATARSTFQVNQWKCYVAPAAIVGRACVVPASSRGRRVVLLCRLIKALLSLVKCLLFAIIVSSVLIIGVVAAVGTYPRLVLRDSQLITDRRPISK